MNDKKVLDAVCKQLIEMAAEETNTDDGNSREKPSSDATSPCEARRVIDNVDTGIGEDRIRLETTTGWTYTGRVDGIQEDVLELVADGNLFSGPVEPIKHHHPFLVRIWHYLDDIPDPSPDHYSPRVDILWVNEKEATGEEYLPIWPDRDVVKPGSDESHRVDIEMLYQDLGYLADISIAEED